MLNALLNNVRSRPELVILLLMVMIIAMLIIPLPTYLIDLLIGLNMVLAILVFMGSFYIDRILSFSTFPSMLLITTLFRLALSISTSRLILINADAGDIIASFGQFVIGDSLAVGFVVFSIVTVVQFIVITKGSERVAEVAARFSLDGMPGKQMSIDADLRAGIIDADAARDRRSVLERESQLYGSFDGAMKFIKGDAIAGIIIIFVNFIGGISVGMTQHNMDLSTALSTYTMLTIGDGLVAQIPALLISISAGFIVTRVNGDSDNMGRNIMGQLLGNPFVLIVTAVLAVALGMLPGFPLFVFLGLALALGLLFFFKFYPAIRQKHAKVVTDASQSMQGMNNMNAGMTGDTKKSTPAIKQESHMAIINDLDKIVAETVPVILLVAAKRKAWLEQLRLTDRLRSQFFIDYGIRLPDILLREDESLSDNLIVLLLNEIRVNQFNIYFDLACVVNYSDEIAAPFGISPAQKQDENSQSAWLRPADASKLVPLGFQIRPALDEFYSCLAIFLTHHVSEYFGIQETKSMLDQMESKYPDLLREVLRYVSLQRITEIFQRLLNERISIRNMKLIMEALALYAPIEKDVISLVEHVRGALSRYICHKFTWNDELRAVMVSSQIEDIVRKGVRQTSGGTFLNLEPVQADSLMDLFSVGLESLHIAYKDIVLITSIDIRRFVKKIIETRFRDLEVLSFGEITDNISVNVIKTI